MEWNRKGIFVIVVLLTLGFGAGGYLTVREQGGLEFTLFRFRLWSMKLFGGIPSATARDQQLARLQAEVVTERILKKYSELRIEPKNVLPEDNGFLAIYRIEGDVRLKTIRDSGILKSLHSEELDTSLIRKELEVYRELGDSIETIAALPDRSAGGMPDEYMGFFPATSAKYMSDYLLLKSRLAAAEKNEAEALRFVKLAVNLGNHFREIEQPSLLTETVMILVELQVRQTVMKHILREVGSGADLENWFKILPSPDYSLARYGFALKGEWNYFATKWSPMIFVKDSLDAIPDPAFALEAYGARVAAYQSQLVRLSFEEYAKIEPLAQTPYPATLSKESLSLLSVLESGTSSWPNAWIRAAVKISQFDAAMDLLIREQSGEDLSEIHETDIENPLTEEPYDFDPKTRTVSGGYDLKGEKTEDLALPW